jgi:DNA gyrase subunit B
MAKKEQIYDGDSIRKLEGLEAVRERPAMYLGDPTSGDALHRLIWEVVDNAVDEHLGGHCKNIEVRLLPDGVVAVKDDGRGIPVSINKQTGKSALELVLCDLHAGGKFDHDSYATSAGLHGVGVSAVNAVSEILAAKVWRDGKAYTFKCRKGIPDGVVKEIGPEKGRGTIIKWLRDLSIFSGVTEYDRKIVQNRLKELAFLNPGLTISFLDLRQKPEPHHWHETYAYAGGIKDFLGELVGKKRGALPILYFTDRLTCDVAFTWTDSVDENVRCYANNTSNMDGGTHLTGFKAGLTKVITAYAKEHGMLKDLSEDGITGGDIRSGIVAVVSVKLADIAFSSQTKDKLVTPKAKVVVEELFNDQVMFWFNENPGIAKKIAERAVVNAKAREAARKAREGVIRKHAFDSWELPGKLSDCQSKDPRESEIVIVEGDSAGGSAKNGRDRRTQAVLPLRGKILNIERANIDAITEHREIATIIGALGCGIEQDRSFDISKLRYHKVIIMTDADDDGSHIRTLLLTLFYRSMPRLILDGHVFVAQPPLYKVASTKTLAKYFRDDAALGAYMRGLEEEYLNRLDDDQLEQYEDLNPDERRRKVLTARSLHITRFKGLGEMQPEELWQTTMHPENRVLRKILIPDAIAAERHFELLMGDDVPTRREWLEAQGNWDQAIDL